MPEIKMVLVGPQIGTLFAVLVIEIEIEMMRLDEIQKMHGIVEGGKFAVGFMNVGANVLYALNTVVANPWHSFFEFLIRDRMRQDHAAPLPLVEALAHVLDRGLHRVTH